MLIKIRLEIREREILIKIAVNSRTYHNRSLILDFHYRCRRSILFTLSIPFMQDVLEL